MRTLGLFARQPFPGQTKTRIGNILGHDFAAALYDCFLRDQFERFRQSGDRRVAGYATSTESAAGSAAWFQAACGPDWNLWPQPMLDLGGRMAAFFAEQGSDDTDTIILIGSDSPLVPLEYLDLAWQRLKNADTVLGPAADGGYWLIGLRGHIARDCSRLFDRIDWSTSAVLQQQVGHIRNCGLTLDLLPIWYDVDSIDAVETLRGHLSSLEVAGLPHGLPRTRAFLNANIREPGYRPAP